MHHKLHCNLLNMTTKIKSHISTCNNTRAYITHSYTYEGTCLLNINHFISKPTCANINASGHTAGTCLIK